MVSHLTAGFRHLTAPAGLILAVIAVTLFIAVAVSVTTAASLNALRGASAVATEQIDTAAEVLDALQDAETGTRGFLLTMRQSYLEPYQGAPERLEAALTQLARLAERAPWLHAEAAALHGAANERMALLQQTVFLARTKGQQAALALVASEIDRASMVAVRHHAGIIRTLAETERERRSTELVTQENRAAYGLAASGALGALLLGFAALRLLLSRARLSRAQDALRIQSARLQGTVNHIRDGIAVFDRDNRLLLWNGSFFPRTGLPTTLARVGTGFAQFADAAKKWEPPLLALPRPDRAPHVTELRRDNLVLEIWRSAMPDGGQMVAVADITQRVAAETMAREAQKLQALGQLTGGVAHDFNNLLQLISVNLELVGGRLQGDAWLDARLSAARAGIERGARLIRYLLAFARRQPLTPVSVDTAGLLRGMEDMLLRSLGPDVRAELLIAPGLWTVRADPHQLENALLNLAINGRDAMPDGGRLMIEAANVTLGAADIMHDSEVRPGDYVMLAVSDTGIGMTPDQLARAMEPFYTTKPEGRGTGLGLSMVYGFAAQSGGVCRLSSEPGHGSTARLYIPRGTTAVEAPQAKVDISSAPDEPGEEGLAVVLVEDDELLRHATADLLLSLGYAVSAFGRGHDALASIDTGTALLITDFALPDINGLALAQAARTLRPSLRVIVVSGKQNEAGIGDDVLWLQKPFSEQMLRDALRGARPVLPQL